MDEIIYLIQIGLTFVLFCLIFNLASNISKCVTDASVFINTMDETFSKSQLKSESFRVLKFQIIKNLQEMKQNFKVSLIAIIVVSMMMVFVGCVSSNNKQLDQKQKEFDTFVYETNMKFDSIQNFFNDYEDQIDSLQIVCQFKDSLLQRSIQDVKKLGDSNKNLNNIIKHQNTMIEKLQKK